MKRTVALYATSLLAVFFGVAWYSNLVPYSARWGSVGEWVSGVGTVITAAIAVIVAVLANRETRETRRQQVHERREAERRQALEVARDRAGRLSWWLVNDEVPRPERVRMNLEALSRVDLDGEHRTFRLLVISNPSQSTIYYVSVEQRYGGDPGGRRKRHIGVLAPGLTHVRVPLPPSRGPSSAMDYDTAQATNADVKWVEFDTGDGYLWRRHFDGRLELTDGDRRDWAQFLP